MPNYYCEYCGNKSNYIVQLTMNTCRRHPFSIGKGMHKVYEGTEKEVYHCKYCGNAAPSIFALTQQPCFRRPDGKGPHLPML